jgi:hypothetical protein
MRSLCFVLAALSYEASEICKLSRKLPADFQELPLPAVTGLVVCPVVYGSSVPHFRGREENPSEKAVK